MATIFEFYNNRDVFITGATGFLGKVLLEKLLFSCCGIRYIYILIRSKRGQDVKERLKELTNSKAFDRIRSEKPESFQKLIAIQGDVAEEGLGLNKDDLNTLINNVTVVFHCAATVRFDDELKTAVKMNVTGTREIINLCHKFAKCEALVYVSTAFCHRYEETLEETVTPMSPTPSEVIEALKWMDDDTVKFITDKLLDGRPNTYTYTKALAESLIASEAGELSVAIIRPSIVEASWKEPFPAWGDSLNGSIGLVTGYMKGILRSVCIKENIIMDTVPLDICTNFIIAIPWHMVLMQRNKVMVYNLTSGSLNSHTWYQAARIGIATERRIPLNSAVRYPNVMMFDNKYKHLFATLFVHWLPALFIDLICILLRKKARLLKIYYKIHKAMNRTYYFSEHQWTFKNENVSTVWKRMSKEEQQCFNFDVRSVDWLIFYQNLGSGIREYVVKEDVSTIPQALRYHKRLYYLDKFVSFIGLLAVGFLLLFIFNTLSKAFH